MRKKSDSDSMHVKFPRLGWVISLLAVIILVLAACGTTTPEAAPAADTPAAQAAATEEPAAEAAEATEVATEEAIEEVTTEATEEATEESTEEATTEALEEATAEATEEATEEPTEEATEEAMEEGAATAEPEEEVSLSTEAAAGQYLMTISRGCGCHFNEDLGGMAGGAFAFEFGDTSVYPANVTPHEETGIGSWSPEEVATAIRTGTRPDGTQLHPIMPYMDFSHLSDEDALNIAAYLLSQEPIENDVPDREVESEPEPFTPDPPSPATAPTDPVERGEYLVKLARCGQCHTPRNEDGSANMEMMLAGNRINEDEVAWNITPHDETGIGALTEEEIATFLRTGVFADGSEVAGTMGEMIHDYFSKLTEDDALAIAAYLKSIPAVENEPE